MIFEITGLSGVLILDMIFIWCFVSMCFLLFIMLFVSLFVENGLLTINNNNIIKKIIKLKNTDKQLYNFADKLDKKNIEFLNEYIKRFEKVIYLSKFVEVKKEFINDNDKRLYKKIESIIYYYDLINKV